MLPVSTNVKILKFWKTLQKVSQVTSLEFLSSWNDQPDEDAFSWIEPKSRLRREGDADDEKVLQAWWFNFALRYWVT